MNPRTTVARLVALKAEYHRKIEEARQAQIELTNYAGTEEAAATLSDPSTLAAMARKYNVVEVVLMMGLSLAHRNKTIRERRKLVEQAMADYPEATL